jgi:ATP-dependent Clp protease, protease subunit
LQGHDEIYLMLSTPGGAVPSGLTLYNFLRSLPCRLVTHNMGNVDSIGNAVFLAADHRIACPHSTFMFHGVGFDVTNGMRLEEKNVRESLESILSDQKRIGNVISDRTSITPNETGELFREASTKDANFAFQKGIVHEISDLQIPAGCPILTLVFN